MGTRAQCLIEDEGIYLYQHWDGDDLFDKVVKAVNGPVGKNRQDDPEYLARIIFCEMVKGCEGRETGYGIGISQHADIEYLVTVNCNEKTITERKIYLCEVITRTEKFAE
jgi:hypothetical protein